MHDCILLLRIEQQGAEIYSGFAAPSPFPSLSFSLARVLPRGRAIARYFARYRGAPARLRKRIVRKKFVTSTSSTREITRSAPPRECVGDPTKGREYENRARMCYVVGIHV